MAVWLDQAGSVLDACMNAFAEPVEYTPSGGSVTSTSGIFDNQSEFVDPDTGAIVTSSEPILGVKDANLPRAPLEEDTLVVRSQNYRVIQVIKDGHGGSKLRLHKI